MATTPKQYFQTAGVNTYVNPLINDGQLIHAVNVDTYPLGAKVKRPGYTAYLDAPGTAQVNSLWQFQKNNGTQFWNYQAQGSKIYYSEQGTGAWTVAGNGTITNGGHVGFAVLNDTMILGDGVGSTRHTTNGTSFTDTTGAPIAPFFTEYQNRIQAQGTASTNFFSVANDASNWALSGTSDSSSFVVGGAGKLSQSFKVADRLVLAKNSGEMKRWDGYQLVDLATIYAPSSPYSIAKVEGYAIYTNSFGIMGYGGGQPELLSNAIQNHFFNTSGTVTNGAPIAGTAFASIPAATWYYNYLASVGTVVDGFVNRVIPNAIIKYDYQKNEFLDWSFAHKPTAMMSALDTSGNRNLYFGDASGNTYVMQSGVTSDNGTAITAEMVLLFHHGSPQFDKNWKWWRGIFNPGCQAVVQVGCSDSLSYERVRKWSDLLSVTDGVVQFPFDDPENRRGRFLFVRIYESSGNKPWAYMGCEVTAEVLQKD